jgi:hypothetical protein
MREANMMRISGRLAFAVICLITAATRDIGAQSAESVLEFTRTLTPEQIRAAGLDKLTQSELDVLNRAAKNYALAIASLAAATPSDRGAPATTPSEVIESRIDGDFTGWEGQTIFKLVNGQIWQQAAYGARNHFIHSPQVMIYRSGSDYRMRVDGVDGEIAVRRLK